MWKSHDFSYSRFVTIHSRDRRQGDDRRHNCNASRTLPRNVRLIIRLILIVVIVAGLASLLTAELDLSSWTKQGTLVTSYRGGQIYVNFPLSCIRYVQQRVASKPADPGDDKLIYLCEVCDCLYVCMRRMFQSFVARCWTHGLVALGLSATTSSGGYIICQ